MHIQFSFGNLSGRIAQSHNRTTEALRNHQHDKAGKNQTGNKQQDKKEKNISLFIPEPVFWHIHRQSQARFRLRILKKPAVFPLLNPFPFLIPFFQNFLDLFILFT